MPGTICPTHRMRDPRPFLCGLERLRVPAVYLSSAVLAILASQANREIINLRRINTHRDFESLSLRHPV
jgi:hypothetical protein